MKAYCTETNKKQDEITAKDFIKIFNFHSRAITFNYYAIWNAKDNAVLEAIHANKLNSLKKANAVLSEKNPTRRRELLERAVTDISLKELGQLKASIKKGKKVVNQTSQKKARAGRKRTKINFGTSKNAKVAEILLIAGQNALGIELSDLVGPSIQWDDFDQISGAFGKMIKLLEKSMGKEDGL